MSAAKDTETLNTASLNDAVTKAYQLHGMLKCLRMAASYSEEQCQDVRWLRAFNYLGLTIDSMIPLADDIVDGIELAEKGKP